MTDTRNHVGNVFVKINSYVFKLKLYIEGVFIIMSLEQLLRFCSKFFSNSTGIEGFINKESNPLILNRLNELNQNPLTYVQLNQMLSIGLIPAVSDGFYNYYWLTIPDKHIYNVRILDTYNEFNINQNSIQSIEHFLWGIERMFCDFLLCFGNINNGYNNLCNKSSNELQGYFSKLRYDTIAISQRGNPFEFRTISKDDRYLISEMVCKTYDIRNREELLSTLIGNFKEAKLRGIDHPRINDLLTGKYQNQKFGQEQLELSFHDELENIVRDEKEINEKCTKIANRFDTARDSAMYNTNLYLSLVHDLDVYMATSMRKKDDFIKMANITENIFQHKSIKDLNLRYFDPTISAADGHEDKGLIECLMVKCCKVLIYTAGDKESYGKDAEAAMALSLGKPVIFFCESNQKKKFYQEVHPLSRLINFQNGVANGILVVDSIDMIAETIKRIFENDMQYKLIQKSNGYYQIIDKLTESVVRIQTSNKLLSNSFWNYYHLK